MLSNWLFNRLLYYFSTLHVKLLYNSLSLSCPSLKTGAVFAFLPSSGISSVLCELSHIITNESEIALASAWSALGGTSSSPADLNLSDLFSYFNCFFGYFGLS